MRTDAGFSLIEVLVVIAITATMAIGASLIFSREDGTQRTAAKLIEDVAAFENSGDSFALDRGCLFVTLFFDSTEQFGRQAEFFE